MFIAALFTIAKIWRQPKYPLIDEWIRIITVHLHNGILLTSKKRRKSYLLQHPLQDGPGEYCAKGNKPGKERKVPYDLTYMWKQMSKICKQIRN